MPYKEMTCEKINLKCGHVLCSGCLSKICRDKNNMAKCPLCRANIKEDCDKINPIVVVDSDDESNDNVHSFQNDHQREQILINGNIGDLVIYEPNNQMGIMYYRISLDNNNNRYLRIVGDYDGFYSDDDINSDDEVGFGGRKKRKSSKKIKNKNRKNKTKKNKKKKGGSNNEQLVPVATEIQTTQGIPTANVVGSHPDNIRYDDPDDDRNDMHYERERLPRWHHENIFNPLVYHPDRGEDVRYNDLTPTQQSEALTRINGRPVQIPVSNTAGQGDNAVTVTANSSHDTICAWGAQIPFIRSSIEQAQIDDDEGSVRSQGGRKSRKTRKSRKIKKNNRQAKKSKKHKK